MAAVKDGASFTYLIGERFLSIDAYLIGTCCDNDQGWDQGYDYDTIRGTLTPPSQDRAGFCTCNHNFGSAHETGFNMAYCDGSVRKTSYDIDPIIHQQLGARNDGQPRNMDDTGNGGF
jgi:prepilin-type processing-associated H-X9-DG protein